MQIEIVIGGEKKKIDLRMKGSHADRIWNKLFALGKDRKAIEESPEKILEYKKLLNVIACEVSGLTEEQLLDLDIEDKQKITGYLEEKSRSEINFMKP